MKKILLVIFFLFSGFCNLFGEEKTKQHLLLWEVEGADQVYLLGEIGAQISGKKDLSPFIWEKFRECKTLPTQVNFTGISNKKFHQFRNVHPKPICR